MIDLQLNSSETARQYRLDLNDAAGPLSIAASIPKNCLKKDHDRVAKHQCLKMHRCHGQKWSEERCLFLELTFLVQNENGVAAWSRLRAGPPTSLDDPGAEASLAEVIFPNRTRTV